MRKTELLKGTTEMILLSLLKENDMYGYELTELLRQVSNDYLQLKEGTLYPALKKLEEKELVKSYWKDSFEGPRRKYYYITKSGFQELEDYVIQWKDFQVIIQNIIEYRR
ncbi:PadR family transcriptional regulator [Bacillus sp. V59.32b]|uniref:PadR family transcriptional regulator n=1 Tax=Bacillus sp. V59.32b TaxID=1758642 RepID=UPI0020B16A69|nr:helix-turn-helix transcriptional regulator [Bacillus sp. V59.32b]